MPEKVFGPKNDEVSEQFGTLYNEEPRDLYRPTNTVKKIRLRWAGHMTRMGVTRNAYRIFVGKERTWKTGTTEE